VVPGHLRPDPRCPALDGDLVRRPAPTQRPIQLHRRGELPKLGLAQPQLGVELAALRVEHLEIARDTGPVPELGELQRAA
jgi:hypothetical protein